MKKVILTLLVLISVLYSSAQNKNRIEIELDPIAYALNGYSVHGIFVHQRIRTDLGVFGIEQPSGYNGNEGFQVRTHGCGLKLNYLLNENQTWFAGIGFGYSINDIKSIRTNETRSERVAGVGLHLGYRWFMFRNAQTAFQNLYLAPWFSVDYNHTTNKAIFEGENYLQQKVTIFPTIHIGYKF